MTEICDLDIFFTVFKHTYRTWNLNGGFEAFHHHMAQEELTGGPGSPGLPGGPSFPCQTQTKGILKHVCENGNVYQAQSHANVIQWDGTSFANPEKKNYQRFL